MAKRNTTQQGDDFRDRTCAVLRAGGFRVFSEVRLGHKNVDAFAEREELGKRKRYAVECKAYAISKKQSVVIVADYLGLVDREVDEILVVANSISPAARQHFESNRGFRALTFNELENLVENERQQRSNQLADAPKLLAQLEKLLNRFQEGDSRGHQALKEAKEKIFEISLTLEETASGSLRLKALLKLRDVTDQAGIDLSETLLLNQPSLDSARRHWMDSSVAMRHELDAVMATGRAGGQLMELRASPELMQQLTTMPTGVVEVISSLEPWDKVYWSLLEKLRLHVGNFKLFVTAVAEFSSLNRSLAHFASREIEREITEFLATMDRLRAALIESEKGD